MIRIRLTYQPPVPRSPILTWLGRASLCAFALAITFWFVAMLQPYLAVATAMTWLVNDGQPITLAIGALGVIGMALSHVLSGASPAAPSNERPVEVLDSLGFLWDVHADGTASCRLAPHVGTTWTLAEVESEFGPLTPTRFVTGEVR
jgi:hypothetical protein